MAADSLFPVGSDNPITGINSQLDASDKALLNALLTDFTSSSPAVIFQGGAGGQFLSGTASGGVIKGVLTPGTGELQGSITNGNLTMEVDIPAGTGITFTGKDAVTATDGATYLNTAIGGYFSPNVDPNSTAGQTKLSLTNAVDDLLGSLGGGKDISVRLIDFLGKTSPGSLHALTTTSGHQGLALLDSSGNYQGVDSLASASQISFDAGTSAGKTVFALNLGSANGYTVALANVQAAVLAGAGTVVSSDNTPIYVTSDNTAQNVTGGGGNDTLVGTGNDTLTGGAGNDIFGITGKGHYTFTDFNKTGDLLYAHLDGVSNIDQLNSMITSVVKTATSVTYNLGPDISVTLIGVAPSDITQAMVKFTLS